MYGYNSLERKKKQLKGEKTHSNIDRCSWGREKQNRTVACVRQPGQDSLVLLTSAVCVFSGHGQLVMSYSRRLGGKQSIYCRVVSAWFMHNTVSKGIESN